MADRSIAQDILACLIASALHSHVVIAHAQAVGDTVIVIVDSCAVENESSHTSVGKGSYFTVLAVEDARLKVHQGHVSKSDVARIDQALTVFSQQIQGDPEGDSARIGMDAQGGTEECHSRLG